jgi:PAS domain-containing protein
VSLVFQVIASLKYRFLNIFPIALQSIVKNMNEGVIIVDSECKIIFANKTASGIFDGFDALHEYVDARELSRHIENNGIFGSDGKVVIDAIEKANNAISGANRRFEFSIHEKTKEIMVKVINSDTNEVIREIPPEKILDMVATMWEMAGIIVDERR